MGSPTDQHFSVNDESSPEGSWNGKYEDFKALGEGLDIPTFQKSAAPYGAAQSLLLQTYEELTTQAYQLADKWQGKAAAEFQNNLRALYVSACNLADATGQVNVAIGYHASDLETLKENVDKMKPDEGTTFNDVFFGDSWDGLGIFHRTTDKESHENAADNAVKKWINNDLTHNTTTYTFGELPKQVKLELPNPTPGVNTPDPTKIPPGSGVPNMGSPGAHGGGAPNLKSPNPHLNTPSPHLNSPSSHLNPPGSHLNPPGSHVPDPNSGLNPPGGHGGVGGGADLSGLNPHDGGGLGKGLGPGGGLGKGLGPGGGGLNGLGPHGLGGGGGLDGLGGGGVGGGGLGGLGRNGLGGAKSEGALGRAGALAGDAAQEEAAAARNAAAGRGGANGMPMGMGGGAGGGQEQERERTTWLTEDEDVWGGDGDVTPPIIG